MMGRVARLDGLSFVFSTGTLVFNALLGSFVDKRFEACVGFVWRKTLFARPFPGKSRERRFVGLVRAGRVKVGHLMDTLHPRLGDFGSVLREVIEVMGDIGAIPCVWARMSRFAGTYNRQGILPWMAN
jgi:hypothetical protein